MKTKLRIHTWPEKILRKKCREVKVVDAKIRGLLDEMHLLMAGSKGVGLAGNQAGVNLNLIVVQWQDRVFKLVNPCIIKKEGEINSKEGCLSLPGLELEIKRAGKVWVSALDKGGEPNDFEAEGVLAVIFQHEIDHLSGKLMIDRISFWQRIKNVSKLKEIKRRTNENCS